VNQELEQAINFITCLTGFVSCQLIIRRLADYGAND